LTGPSTYGTGFYLAPNSSRADEYSSADADGVFTMLLCRVLLGRVHYTDEVQPDTVNINNLGLEGRGGFGCYQSVLGDREKSHGSFKEIVVFDSNYVYPEFIIQYKRIFD